MRIERLSAGYGQAQVLRDVTLDVRSGEILCLLGRNGAGKTTLLQAVMGLVPAWGGSVTLDGTNLTQVSAYEVPKHGIGYVPQRRRLFGSLTVAENLEIGRRARGSDRAAIDDVLQLFPVLKERLSQVSQTLSGGEQQMLAMARALCLRPSVLMLDEPTEGLQPSMIEAIRNAIVQMRDQGVAVLLVEQRVDAVLEIADRVAVMETGVIKEVLPAQDLRMEPARIAQLIGV